MKKIIALLTLFLAFTFNVSAQEKANITELAKKDVETLSRFTKITPQNEATYMTLFTKKHEAYTQQKLVCGKKKNRCKIS